MGSCDTPGSAADVSVKGDYAYVADGAAGMKVVDVSDPAHPAVVGGLALPGAARHLTLSEGVLREDFESTSAWTKTAGTLSTDTTHVKHGVGVAEDRRAGRHHSRGPAQQPRLGPLSGQQGLRVLGVPAQRGGAGRERHLAALPEDVSLQRQRPRRTPSTTAYNLTVHDGWNLLRFGPDDWKTTGSPSWSRPIQRLAFSVATPAEVGFEVSFDELRTGATGLRPAFLWTFDDGYDENYDDVLPYLSARGAAATIYVTANRVGTGASWITLPHLQALYDAGWAVGNHTWDHTDLSTLSQAAATAKIRQGYDWLVAHGFTRAARHLAYPYNSPSEASVAAAVDCGVLSARLGDKRNVFLPMDDAYRISSFSFDDASSTVAVWQARIQRAIANGGTIVANCHQFDATSLPHVHGGRRLPRPSRASGARRRRVVGHAWSRRASRRRPAAGRYAYVACGDAGVQVVDVEPAGQPRARRRLQHRRFGRRRRRERRPRRHRGRGARPAGRERRRSRPARSLIGSSLAPGGSLGVCVGGGLAYVAEGSSGLRIVSLAAPVEPGHPGPTCDTAGRRPRRRRPRQSKAYVADGPGGLSVIDVSDPAHPALTARHSVSGEAQALVVFGGNAYVAGGAGGFQVVPLGAQ